MHEEIILKYLTPQSQTKIGNLLGLRESNKIAISNLTSKLFHQMIRTGFPELMIKPRHSNLSDLKTLRKVFVDFDQDINSAVGSKFQNDVNQMSDVKKFILDVNNDKIKINVLSDVNDQNNNLITGLLMAINMFSHMFPYKYDGLTINICLDNNKRDIIGKEITRESFDTHKKKSVAFNVSGLTNRSEKLIILTKKEEIIKLLFHELIHYVGLDRVLVDLNYQVEWNISDPQVNISEAYTEYCSIILNCIFSSIIIGANEKINFMSLINFLLHLEFEYSLYLTASILKLYGYDDHTYQEFFSHRKSTPMYSPICTWEYVILRTMLYLNSEKIDNMSSLKLNTQTKNIILDIFDNDIKRLIEQLKNRMYHSQISSNIAYTCIELDWNKI